MKEYKNEYLRLDPDEWYPKTWILSYRGEDRPTIPEMEKYSREIEDWITPGDYLISYAAEFPIHLGPWEETGMYRGPEHLIYKRTGYGK